MKLTLEALVNAIRSGSDIAELKRMVGASKEETEAAKQRLAQMDLLEPACKFDEFYPDAEAQAARERYKRIEQAQAAYENQYC